MLAMFKVGDMVLVTLKSEEYVGRGKIVEINTKKSLPFIVEVDTPFFTVFNDPIYRIPCSWKELTLCE